MPLKFSPWLLLALFVYVNAIYAQTPIVDGPYIRYDGNTIIAGRINQNRFVIEKFPASERQQRRLMVPVQGHPDWNFTIKLKPSIANEAGVYKQPGKLFICSDIEGEFGAFRSLLIANHIINTKYEWLFGNGRLVIAGDLFDRGRDVTALLWLLYKLEDEAAAKGGRVHVILGNHDIMNLSGDFRYVDKKYFDYAELMQSKYDSLYNENTELGRWLRSKNIIEKIGKVLVLHGGISPEINALRLSVDSINALCRPYYALAHQRDKIPVQVRPFFSGQSSPFWYRGYFLSSQSSEQLVDSTLDFYQVKRIIVGHTIVEHVHSLYHGKVIPVDVDEHAGQTVGLLIDNNNWYTTDISGNKQPLLNWTADWIGPGYSDDTLRQQPVVFSKKLTLAKKIKRATAYITCHGIYEASVNNIRVGAAYFTPGWTSYDHRLQYQQYDVTKLLQANNRIVVTVAGGWYLGVFGGKMERNNYGRDPGLLFQLNIEYVDGTSGVINSDSTWRSGHGPVLDAGFYGGEMVNFNKQVENNYSVTIQNCNTNNLVPTVSEPVTKQEIFSPLPVRQNIVDFGQNISGWVQIKAQGKQGDTIKIEHAETLDKEGEWYTANLREAAATDVYVLKGSGEQVLEPHFTIHGFRYARITGCDTDTSKIRAIAVYSALKHTGSFECSDPLINKLQHNIEWSLNDNFVDVPTDCPQRSERLGWTGDAQVFCRTAALNRGVKQFFSKWLMDLAADQGSNGGVPSIVPDLYGHTNTGKKNGRAGWGDAATIVPSTLFDIYGDTMILRRQYESMQAWVDYIVSDSKDYLWKRWTYGDWYAPKDSTSTDLIDQCFFAYSTQLLVNAAIVLGREYDAKKYTGLLQQVKAALLQNYFNKDGRAITHTQTAYILALQFNLLPDSLSAKAIEHLVGLIHENDDRLATGFLGTPYILPVLSKYGYSDLAYTLLKQRTPPSWLYPITKGATTIWEKWEAIRPDGSFDTCSLNHYAYGAVGSWLYETVAGIKAEAPGYRKIIIEPHPGGGLTYARARYQCPYGEIKSEWKIIDKRLIVHVEIPKGTTAIIRLPGEPDRHVGPGKYNY